MRTALARRSTSAVLHGLRVVAALKLRQSRFAWTSCRTVLHGLRVVAALKLDERRACRRPATVVLHGLRAVAALKRLVTVGVDIAELRFSTAFGPWPH